MDPSFCSTETGTEKFSGDMPRRGLWTTYFILAFENMKRIRLHRSLCLETFKLWEFTQLFLCCELYYFTAESGINVVVSSSVAYSNNLKSLLDMDNLGMISLKRSIVG